MAALPSAVYLCRHALPTHFLRRLPVRPPLAQRPSAPPPARPRLLLRWHVGADGRPAARWVVEPSPG